MQTDHHLWSKKINRTCDLVDAAVSVDHWKKKSKNIERYLDFVRELKTLCNMRMTVFPVVIVLYVDIRPGHTCYSKVMHRKEVTHSDGSYGKKSRRRVWLTIWDKLISQCTVIDWCTGREWPVNSMTVISAWWRSNVPFQRYWVGDWTII